MDLLHLERANLDSAAVFRPGLASPGLAITPTNTTETSRLVAERQGPGESAINRVGVVGLGHMGHAFAVNLIEDGYQVVVYDQTRSGQRHCKRVALSMLRDSTSWPIVTWCLRLCPTMTRLPPSHSGSGLGQRLFVISEDAALANLFKLAANILTATTLECMGEVLVLLRKGGIDGPPAFDILTNSLFDSRVHKSYGGKIVEGRYSPPACRCHWPSKICGLGWPKPNAWLCLCPRQASSTTTSSL
ncbi:MAG TPA: NAD(P)-binding domain-containing protein [Methylocella sp.]|nr:NAD(P)-binding domain-containing protein [Methylocella sp.]